MAVVLFVALAIAALRESNDLWSSCLFTVTLLVLGIACLGAVFRRGAYAGFASFGLGYLALVYCPWASMEIRPHLATTKLIDYAGTRVLSDHPQWQVQLFDAMTGVSKGSVSRDFASPSKNGVLFINGTVFPKPRRDMASFERIGHSLFALAFGVVGGIAARYFRETRTASSP